MKYLFSFLIFLYLLSCSDSNSVENNVTNGNGSGGSGNNNSSWSIDKDKVFDGGPGKDGIPALLDPKLINASSAGYLSDSDLVIGIKDGDQIIAFPHRILDWHEIINIDINDKSIAVTYCPLTGTGIGWNRNIANTKTTFGVSGLLYQNNLIPYDRATDSNWSQLKLECVNGVLKDSKPDVTVLPEMNWGVWKKIYPQTKVISLDTGFSRDYGNYPYGGYKTDNNYFIFPVASLVNNIPAKERVHVIISNGNAKVYRFNNFNDGKVIKDSSFQSTTNLIVGNQDFIISFQLDKNTKDLNFTYNFKGDEIMLSDNEGNQWSIFGEAISGPRKGSFLEFSKTSMMAYYFSLESFYPNLIIFN